MTVELAGATIKYLLSTQAVTAVASLESEPMAEGVKHMIYLGQAKHFIMPYVE